MLKYKYLLIHFYTFQKSRYDYKMKILLQPDELCRVGHHILLCTYLSTCESDVMMNSYNGFWSTIFVLHEKAIS